jgi:hypothetical protein
MPRRRRRSGIGETIEQALHAGKLTSGLEGLPES